VAVDTNVEETPVEEATPATENTKPKRVRNRKKKVEDGGEPAAATETTKNKPKGRGGEGK